MLHIYVRNTANGVGLLLVLAVLVFAFARASQAGDLPRGEAVYAANCASCHGASAEGTPRGGPLLHFTSETTFLQEWETEHPRLYAATDPSDRAELWRWLQGLRPVTVPTPTAASQTAPSPGSTPPTAVPSPTVAATASPVAASPTPAATAPPPGAVEAGAVLYAQRCARCHGAAAEGTPQGPRLTGIPDQAAFFAAWERDHASMFAGMAAEQRAAIWAWLQSVR